jgi:hypothetical protein
VCIGTIVPRQPRRWLLLGACVILLVAGLGLYQTLTATDERAVAARFLGVAAKDLVHRPSPGDKAPADRAEVWYELQKTQASGLSSASLSVKRKGQYVRLCAWTYLTPPRHRVTDAQARTVGQAFLKAKFPFYRSNLPIGCRVTGDPSDRTCAFTQAVPAGAVTYFVHLFLDRGGRPTNYTVSSSPKEPPAVSPVKVTRQQALTIVQRELARSLAYLKLQTVEVLGVRTRSHFAPEGQPVYVVRVEPAVQVLPGATHEVHPRSFDWGVHATTGKLLKQQAMPPPSGPPPPRK